MCARMCVCVRARVYVNRCANTAGGRSGLIRDAPARGCRYFILQRDESLGLHLISGSSVPCKREEKRGNARECTYLMHEALGRLNKNTRLDSGPDIETAFGHKERIRKPLYGIA